jgi:hypothetical protein
MRPIKTIALLIAVIAFTATGFAGAPSADVGPPGISKHKAVNVNDVFSPITIEKSQVAVPLVQFTKQISQDQQISYALYTYSINSSPQWIQGNDQLQNHYSKDFLVPDNDYRLRPWEYYAKSSDWRAFKIIKYVSVINKPPSGLYLLI